MRKLLITEEDKRHILSLYNLVEDFKSQRLKFMDQGYDEQIVNKYLNDFREIKDKKYKEAANIEMQNLNVPKGNDRFNIDSYKTFKELEMLVDYVSGQRNVGEANFTDIKVDGKPIFENDSVEIYFAPNKQSCIEYKGDKPYSWCISRADASNMYTRYRMTTEEPSFYFVKRKKEMEKEFAHWDKNEFKGSFVDKWHFFVLQVLNKSYKRKDGILSLSNPNKEYVITSANNDGEINTNWDGVLKVAPELDGLRGYFKNVPLTDVEKEKFEMFDKGISDEQYSKLPYSEKLYYMDVAVDNYRPLSDSKFINSPDDIKNKYINFGFNLTDAQLNSIKDNSKLMKRFKETAEKIADSLKGRQDANLGGGNVSYEKIGKNQFDVLSPETKERLSKLLQSDVDRYLYRRLTSGPELNAIKKHLNGERILSPNYFATINSFIPDVSHIIRFADKENFLNHIKNGYIDDRTWPKKEMKDFLFKLASVTLFFKPKEQLTELLNFLNMSFDDFMNTLNEEESQLIEKLVSGKNDNYGIK